MTQLKTLMERALDGDVDAIRQLRRQDLLGDAPPRKSWPLSNAQQRLWMLYQIDPANAAYNMPAAFMLTGPLDRSVLEKAFQSLIRRHESLRTIFRMENGSPRQVINPPEDPPTDAPVVRYRDLRLSEHPEASAEDLSRRDAMTPFDLEKGPLIRIHLLQLPSDADGIHRHLLLFNMHHIISDGWSINILIREFSMRYNAIIADAPDPLTPLRIQYKDVVVWQEKHFKDAEMTAHREYWQRTLSGRIPALDLPLDKPRPPFQTFNGASATFTLNGDTTEQLRQIARTNGTSLFMVISAAVKTLLNRYTGQEDIIVGSPVAGRYHPDMEDQVGFFVNLLALRDTVTGSLRFTELLTRIRDTLAEAQDHQAYPFDRLVDELSLSRNLSRSPLFDVLVVFQNRQAAEFSLTDVEVVPHPREFPVSRFDWTLYFEETRYGLSGKLIYNTDLFSFERMQRCAVHLGCLMSSIAATPDAELRTLTMIPDEERRLMREKFNATDAKIPCNRTIAAAFEAQASKTPDRQAVMFKSHTLTYGELNRTANALARLLRRRLNVTSEERVAVMLPRSHLRIVALLGVLKAGAAYVPVDPDYPEDRVRFMLEDAECRIALVDNSTAAAAAGMRDGLTLVDVAALPPDPPGNPEPIGNADSTAYIIYTSGSTGRPKGVMLAHRGFLNMILAQIGQLGVARDDRVLQFASASFDGSMYEIFLALLSGASLVCPDADAAADPEALLTDMKAGKVTVAAMPPSYLKVIGFEQLRFLKILITAGESAVTDHGKFTSAGGAYWNLYGPTETSVTATAWRFPENAADTNPPIGRPVANMKAFVLDPKGEALQPIGIPGEICLSGIGLAKGYLNRPDLTAEKFVPNPHLTGRRMYRTGDLGVWRADGNLGFLGRIDHQVKIRGFRIEPEEIRNRLLAHPGIDEAVVHPMPVGGEIDLVAYYTGDDDIAPADLKETLAETLPEYMVPHHFVKLHAVPRTPNNKIDVHALPPPTRPHAGAVYVPPTGEIEAGVLEVWRSVLGIERIGVNDSFFDIGGNSLRLIQLRQGLRERFETDLSIVELFRYPTIGAIAKRLGGWAEEDAHEIGTDAGEKRHARRADLRTQRQARRRHRDELKSEGEN